VLVAALGLSIWCLELLKMVPTSLRPLERVEGTLALLTRGNRRAARLSRAPNYFALPVKNIDATPEFFANPGSVLAIAGWIDQLHPGKMAA
jgi:hypothetical protein